jgi:hypothetical protein
METAFRCRSCRMHLGTDPLIVGLVKQPSGRAERVRLAGLPESLWCHDRDVCRDERCALFRKFREILGFRVGPDVHKLVRRRARGRPWVALVQYP